MARNIKVFYLDQKNLKINLKSQNFGEHKYNYLEKLMQYRYNHPNTHNF